MFFHGQTIVICHGARTPFGVLGKILADVPPEELMGAVFAEVMKRARLLPAQVDGVMVGWVGEDSHSINIARVAALRLGLPVTTPALTLQANCVAGLEAVCAAVGRILAGDGELFLVGGTESMSRIPFAIRGTRSSALLRSLATVKDHWADLLHSADVSLVDMLEEGLTDPVAHINMGATAEVLAQIFRIDRGAQDHYAMESVRRAVAASQDGFYSSHLVPVTRSGATLLDQDETTLHRSVILGKPRLMEKAPALFDNNHYALRDFYRDNGVHLEGAPLTETSHGTVTLLNSCGRSDGAAGLIVTTGEKAKALGLEVLAEVAGWAFRGIEPERMGLAPALATEETLKRVGLSFDQLDLIELHEPFAASVLALFKYAKENFGQDWESAHAAGRVNAKGGTLALGHPIAATGVRILLTLGYALKELRRPCWGLAGACASGGMGGAMVLRRPTA